MPPTNFLSEEKADLVLPKKSKRKVLFLAFCSFSLLFLYLFLFRAPSDFPTNKIVTVSKGSTLRETSEKLEKQGVVRSATILSNFIVLLGKERQIASGDYIFTEKENVFEIAKKISKGEYGPVSIKVTIPEGSTLKAIADLFPPTLYNFNKTYFLTLTKNKEGYLFPDTYLFQPNVTTEQAIALLEDTFAKKISLISKDIAKTGRSIEDIIIMASILEGEARTTESRRIISGILWKRLSIGMALQVDATIRYVTGRGTSEITQDDLKMDSPFNTYRYAGMPPTPIANPGMDSILASINPVSSPYLYFLTDNNGEMHYASTFEQHVKNKSLYLR